ncbi:UNVERIFIED_CONTAM: hypothetical protein FKN15_040271 [Acipenser sinensis]
MDQLIARITVRGIPCPIIVAWAIGKLYYENEQCWFGKEPGKYIDYIYQGPVILVLLSLSFEHILRILIPRPFGIALLVCIGCAEDMCKYWCMSVGLQKSEFLILPHVVLEVGFTGTAHKNQKGAEVDATQFAAMMDLLSQTLTAAGQGAARPMEPDPRLQRLTKVTAEDRPEAYLEVFEAMATSAGWDQAQWALATSCHS